MARGGWGLARAARLAVVVGVGVMLGSAGCGGSSGTEGGGLSSGEAVRVGSQSISVATVDHWIPIEAVLSNNTQPTSPVEAGVIPDPPLYKACSAWLAAVDAKQVAEQPKHTPAELKHECQARDTQVHRHMLAILILNAWIRGEAAAHGIDVTDSEATQRIQANIHTRFGGVQQYQKYLKYSGLSPADDLLLNKKNLLSDKLLSQVLLRPGLNDQQHRRAYAEFITRWVAKTSCKPEYTIPDCKQYKGPEPPGE